MTRIDLRCDCGCNPARPYAYRTLLDGVDVSKQCFMADDVRGEVGLYLRDADGRFYKDRGSVALEFRRGVVTLLPPS